jgi:hypothetical protein
MSSRQLGMPHPDEGVAAGARDEPLGLHEARHTYVSLMHGAGSTAAPSLARPGGPTNARTGNPSREEVGLQGGAGRLRLPAPYVQRGERTR